jgi:undecaprenyl pyrophosphate phosphatase UppP
MDILREFFAVIVLGFVQGLSEFLPISSSAHLSFASQILNHQEINKFTINFFQLGTVIAVYQFFWSDIKIYLYRLLEVFRKSEARLTFSKILRLGLGLL